MTYPRGHSCNANRIFSLEEGILSALALAPDGRLLASSSTHQVETGQMKATVADIVLRDAGDGAIIFTGTGDRARVDCLCFSPKGDLLASAGLSGEIILWNVPRGNIRWTLKTDRPVRWLSFSSDGALLAAAGVSGSVLVYKTAGPMSPLEFTIPRRDPILHLSFLPSDVTLGLLYDSRSVALLDPAYGNLSFPPKLDFPGKFQAISPDLNYVLSSDYGTEWPRLFLAKKGTAVASLGGVDEDEREVALDWAAFSGDGRTLAACLGTVYSFRWEYLTLDLPSLKQKGFPFHLSGQYDHPPKIKTLSGNGKRMAAGENKTIEIWDFEK